MGFWLGVKIIGWVGLDEECLFSLRITGLLWDPGWGLGKPS